MEKAPRRLRYRYLVRSLDLDLSRALSQRIVQGFLYMGERTSLQVDNEQRDDRLVWKSSFGFVHVDQERNVPWAFARILGLFCHKRVIRKTRYVREGWFIDLYHGVLTGIVIAERNILSVNERIRLPDCVTDAEDATDWLTDRALVQFLLTVTAADVHNLEKSLRDLLRERAKPL